MMNKITRRLRALSGAVILVLVVPAVSSAMKLKPETVLAWDAYIAATETRIERELTFQGGGFLALDFMPDAELYRGRLLGGEVLVFEINTTDEGGEGIPIPDGTIHHWRGTVFLPGVNLDTYLFHAQHPDVGVPEQPEVLEKRAAVAPLMGRPGAPS